MPFHPDRAGAGLSAVGHVTIVPHDANDIAYIVHAIYVGGGGDVAVVDQYGTVCVYKGVPAGGRLDVCAKRVNATSTTATFMIGQY